MAQLLESIVTQINPLDLLDIAIVAVLIYWAFSLIRGTRAVSLVVGVTVLFVVYALADALGLQLLTQIMQTGAVVGVFALVVVFQPELRRALERIGRVGSFGWLLAPAETRATERVAAEVARAAAQLSAEGHGALIVLERETGLEEVAETGVMLHADLSADLLCTVFTPRTALHDGAVIIRDDTIIAAGAVLPLAETTIHTERFGTRHRAALGITEQTDAVVVVVSEENAQISLVERARIVRNLNEAQLARAIRTLLTPQRGRSVLGRGPDGRLAARTPRLADLARIVGRERRVAGEGGPGPEPVGPPTRPTILPHEPAPRDGAGAAQPGIDGGSTVVPVDELPTTTSSAGAAPSASRTGHAAARRVDGGVRTAEEEPAGRVPS